jgi:hypothetical protein
MVEDHGLPDPVKVKEKKVLLVLHLITVKARRVAPLSRNPESLTVTSYCKKICMSEMTTSIFSFITLFTPHKQALSLSISYQPHRDSPVANAIIFSSLRLLFRL